MNLIFCCDPFDPKQVDEAFASEANASQELGIKFGLIDHDAVLKGGRIVRCAPEGPCIYRGWMLRPEQYQTLYTALEERGAKLITSPDQYRNTHHFPYSYSTIEPHTAKSVWTQNLDADLANLLSVFGNKPIILKDFVKSRKHEWAEACYIPDASDLAAVKKTVSKFLELQGPDFNEGLVFREFLNFKELGKHPQSALPLFPEYRIFYRDGKASYFCWYWGKELWQPHFKDKVIPAPFFEEIASQIDSPFFTMDIALTSDDRWKIVEVGDGQVSGLPESEDRVRFLKNIFN